MNRETVIEYLGTLSDPIKKGKAWKTLNMLQKFGHKVDGQETVSRWRFAERYCKELQVAGNKLVMKDGTYYENLPATMVDYVRWLQIKERKLRLLEVA